MELSGKLAGREEIVGSLSSNGTISGNLVLPEVISPPKYVGPYEVMPGEVELDLDTGGLVMTKNVTVSPIPNNYGLITWNGLYLTVS